MAEACIHQQTVLVPVMRFPTQTVAEIAATVPGATAVFHKHGIDFCGGGDQPIGAAAVALGLDPALIEAEVLSNVGSGAEPPAEVSTPALVKAIVNRYHDGHRRDLEELLVLSQRVETVHAEHPDCPLGLITLLSDVRAELYPHMQKEEQILFPMMLAGGSPLIIGPITCMVGEHDEFASQLARLEALSNTFQAPPGACGTWKALYRSLAHFAEEAREHVHMENNVLFPRFAAVAPRAKG